MNCTLTLKQQKLLVGKVAIDLKNAPDFVLDKYLKDFYDLVLNQTKDPVLAANYVALLPMNIRAVALADKGLATKVSQEFSKIMQYENSFEDFSKVEDFLTKSVTPVGDMAALEKTLQKESLTAQPQQEDKPAAQPKESSVGGMWDMAFDVDKKGFLKPDMKVYADAKKELIDNYRPDGTSSISGQPVKLVVMSTQDFKDSDYYSDTQEALANATEEEAARMRSGVVITVVDLQGEPVRVNNALEFGGDGKLLYYQIRNPKKGDVLNADDKQYIKTLQKQFKLTEEQATAVVQRELNNIVLIRKYINKDPNNNRIDLQITGGQNRVSAKVPDPASPIRPNAIDFSASAFAPYFGVPAQGQKANVAYFNYPGTDFPITLNRPNIPSVMRERLVTLMTEDVYKKYGSKRVKLDAAAKLRLFKQLIYISPDVLDISVDKEGNFIVKAMGVTTSFADKSQFAQTLTNLFTKVVPQRKLNSEEAKRYFTSGASRVLPVNQKFAMPGQILERTEPDGSLGHYMMGPFQLSINKSLIGAKYIDFDLTNSGEGFNLVEKEADYNDFIKNNFILGFDTPQPAGSTLNFQVSPKDMVKLAKGGRTSYKGLSVRPNADIKGKGGRLVGAQLVRSKNETDPNYIVYNKEALQEKFLEKAWTKPKVEGVNPLPEDVFKTYAEWEDFVLEHEYQHHLHPQEEEETNAAYENRINQLALSALKAQDAPKLFNDDGSQNEAAYALPKDAKNVGINAPTPEAKLSAKDKLLKLKKENPKKFNKIVGQKGLEATVQQMEAAAKWYQVHPLAKYFPYETLFDVINTEDQGTIARWTLSGITLFKGSDYSDLYHEAWHGFSQGFLSSQDKEDLYNEAKKKRGSFVDYQGNKVDFKDANDLQIEEFLAEDFRSYMLSDGKASFTSRPKTKNIFQRIWETLKYLFGSSSVKDAVVDSRVNKKIGELYEKLRVGDISEYSFAAQNRNYNTLNKALTATSELEPLGSLNFSDSNLLFQTVNSLFSEGVDVLNEGNLQAIKEQRDLSAKENKTPEEEQRLSDLKAQNTSNYTTAMLNSVKGLSSLYEYAKDRLSEQLQDYLGTYSVEPSTALDNKIKLLQYALRNFGDVENLHTNQRDIGVIGYHLYKSDFVEDSVLDELKSIAEEESRAEEGKQYFDRGGNETSIFDLASKEVWNILRSLNKTDDKGVYITNALGFPEMVNSREAFAQVARVVQNSNSLTEMYSKLEKEQTNYYPLKQLLSKMGPLSYDEQTSREVDLWSKFYQTFNKYRIPLIQTTVNKSTTDDSVIYDIKVGNALADYKQISTDWKAAFRSTSNHPFIQYNIKGNQLDLPALLDKYDSIAKVNADPYQFLFDVGITLKDVPVVREELSKAVKSGTIRLDGIYNNLVQLNTKGIAPKSLDIFLNHNPDLGVVGQTGPNSNYGKLLALQSKYSGEYSDFMVQNAAGDPQSEFSQNNTLTQLVKSLNGVKSFNELVNTPATEQYNNSKNTGSKPYNPFISSSIWINALFDMSSNGGKKDATNLITIDNLSGINSSVNDNIFEEGVALAQADEISKLLSDFHTQLMRYTPELTRHAGKKTSLAVYLRNYKTGAKNPRLYIDTEDFVGETQGVNAGSDKFCKILIKYLASELDRVNYCKELLNPASGVEQFDFKYLERGSKFAIFAGILSDETKDALYQLDVPLLDHLNTPEGTVLSDKIYDEITAYLGNITSEMGAKLSEYNFVSPSLLEKTRKDALAAGNTQVDAQTIKRGLTASFVANNWIQHYEEMVMFYGDAAQYKDFFKRNASLNSTGDIMRNDPTFLEYVNTKLKRSFQEQLTGTSQAWDGTINAAIVSDVEVASHYLEEYKKTSPNPVIETKYGEVNEADAQGIITMDSYRIILDGLGKWTLSQEEAYQHLLAGKSAESIDVVNTFPVLKMGQYGPVKNQYLPLTGLHKFSLMPLIPGVISANLKELHEKMMREGVDYLTFKSGSKVGTITNRSGMEPLYSDVSTRTLNTAPFVINKTFSDYLKYQVESAPVFKGKITFMTQLRKLAELGLMEGGVPVDYTGSAEEWEKLSEAEKLKQSKKFGLRKNYLDALRDLVDYNKQKLLDDIGWKENKDGTLSGDMSSLLKLVSRELKRTDVGEHEWAYIQTIGKNEIKNSLDVSQSAEVIEKILVALINKRLVNLKVKGEQFVLVANTGWENKKFAYKDNARFTKPTAEDLAKYGTNDLPTYHLKDGKIAAAKVKIAMQGDFKKLLNLPEVEEKSKKTGLSRLQALNRLLKDEAWLNTGDNRAMVSMVGARIPTQGPNSTEFMEVYEFLPEIAGNILIAPSEITAKGGSDFDYDKLPLMSPSIRQVNGKVELAKDYSDEQAKEAYDALIKAELHKMTFEGLDKHELRALLETSDRFARVDKVISDLWGPEYYDMLLSLAQENVLKDFKTFKEALNGSANIENRLIAALRGMMEQPSNFESLIRPNDTDIVKPLADEMYAIENKGKSKDYDKEGTRMFEALKNTQIQQSNSIGKDTLGIGAIANTFNALFNAVGLQLNPQYNVNPETGVGKRAVILLPHNTGKDAGISLSKLMDAHNTHSIAEIISQLINGWVDVEKDDWISYIQGNKELAPVMLFMVQAGVPIKDVVYFLNQPLIKEYVKEQRLFKSNFGSVLGKESEGQPRRMARNAILDSPIYNFDVELKNSAIYNKTLELTAGKEFYADNLRSRIEGKEITDFDKAVFLHFLELENLSKGVDKIVRAFNVDTTPLQNLTEFYGKMAEVEDLYNSDLYDHKYIDRLKNDSPVGPFYVQEFGLELFGRVLPVRNNKVLNEFLNELTESDIGALFSLSSTEARMKFNQAFKNDLLQYVYQQQVRDFTHKDLTEEQYHAYWDLTDRYNLRITSSEFLTFLENKKSLQEQYPEGNDMEYEERLKRNLLMTGLRKEGETDSQFEQRIKELSYEQWIDGKALYALQSPSVLFSGLWPVTSKFEFILNKYPQLSQYFSILNNIRIDGRERYSNLKLASTKLSKDEIDVFHENLENLAKANEVLKVPGVTQEDAEYISDFFSNLPLYLYMQAGANTKGPFSFARVLPQEKIVRLMEKPIQELPSKINKPYLFNFLSKFVAANSDKTTKNRFKDYLSTEYDNKVSPVRAEVPKAEQESQESTHPLWQQNKVALQEKYSGLKSSDFEALSDLEKQKLIDCL